MDRFKTTQLPLLLEKKVHDFLKQFKAKAKLCYYNAQSLAIEYDDFEYWEGYAIHYFGGSGVPMEHGWNVVDGVVVDITWRGLVEDQHILYFGCKIPTDFVVKRWFKDRYSQGYLIDYVGEVTGRKKGLK